MLLSTELVGGEGLAAVSELESDELDSFVRCELELATGEGELALK